MKHPILHHRSIFQAAWLLVFATSAVAPALIQGNIKEWIQSEGGSFHEGEYWSPPGEPGPADEIRFDLGEAEPYLVTLHADGLAGLMNIFTDRVEFDLGGRKLEAGDLYVANGTGGTGFLKLRDGEVSVGQNLQVGQGSGSDATFIFENGTLNVGSMFRGPMNNTSYARIELRNSIVDVGRMEILRDADVEIRGTTLTSHDQDIRLANSGNPALQHVVRMLVTDGSHVTTHRNFASSNNANNLTELTISGPGTVFEITGNAGGGDWNGAWEGDAVTVIKDGALVKVGRDFRPGGAGSETITVTGASVEVGGRVLFGHRFELTGGSGSLILDSATMTSGLFLSAGDAEFSSGSVLLRGGSVWTSTIDGDGVDTRIGNSVGATGEVRIEEGSRFSVLAGNSGSGVDIGLRIGSAPGSEGTVTVTGENSLLDGEVMDIFVGGGRTAAGGSGILEVTDGGRVEAGGDLHIWYPGSLRLDGGTVLAGSLGFAEPRQYEEETLTHQVPVDAPETMPVTDGLAVWLAADLLGLDHGDPVALWEDASGNGHHLAQPLAAARPTYVADVIGGKPVVRFDGSNDHLYMSQAFDSAVGQPNQIFVVFQSPAPTNGGRVFDKAPAGSDRQTLRLTSGGGQMHAGSGIGGGFNNNGWNIHDLLFDGVSSHWYARTLSTVAMGEGNTGTRTMESLQLGADFRQDRDFFQGDIAEVLVFDRALNDEERIAVEDYLAGKYGLPVWRNVTQLLDETPEIKIVLGDSSEEAAIQIAGNVFLDNAPRLAVEFADGFSPSEREQFRILSYGGSISGHFADLPEWGRVKLGETYLRISYADGWVTLTEAPPAPDVPVVESMPALEQSLPLTAGLVLEVELDGPVGMELQWFKDGVAIEGATGNRLSLSGAGVHMEGVYHLRVTWGEDTMDLDPILVEVTPFAGPDTVERMAGKPVKIPVESLLANDLASDGGELSLETVSGVSANGGSVYLEEGWVFYLPPDGNDATDTFTYVIRDARDRTAEGTVTVELATGYEGPSRAILSLEYDAQEEAWRLRIVGFPGQTYEIQQVETLGEPWVPLGEATEISPGLYQFLDYEGAQSSQRFYRAVRQ